MDINHCFVIFIYMRKYIKENELGDRMMTGQSFVQGGGSGNSVGTYSSPDVSQNPASFVPNIAGSQSNITVKTPPDSDNKPLVDPGQYDNDVEEIKDKITPDEILTGLQYELKRMVFKRKDLAKVLVVNNLKKDPKYYSKLHMLNIDDNDNLPAEAPFIPTQNPYQSEPVVQQTDAPQDWRTPQEKAIAEIIRKMAKDKHEKRYPTT
jgi:hypothetical protein